MLVSTGIVIQDGCHDNRVSCPHQKRGFHRKKPPKTRQSFAVFLSRVDCKGQHSITRDDTCSRVTTHHAPVKFI